MTVSTSPTIHIDATEGKAYGACAAALLGHIRFWVRKNEETGNNLRAGRYWTFDTFKALSERLVMFTPDQVRRGIEKLLKLGLIEKGHYGHAYDRTSWYTLASAQAPQRVLQEEPTTPRAPMVADADPEQAKRHEWNFDVPKNSDVELEGLPDGCVWMREDGYDKAEGQLLDKYRACTLSTAVDAIRFAYEEQLDEDVARAWIAGSQFKGAYFDLTKWDTFVKGAEERGHGLNGPVRFATEKALLSLTW